ncbi:MAG TPA: ribbon-helix-helix protein, CopG family [Anaerolineae bacterium]|nr:ribbon-helix-helix protein, CopG family [Anaerolineae bacterium]HID84968.1 ribbon-helix-helix protein, CopG family [Anaerolineales bacterium]HIQ08666.1 ribbon-helix-helix protein, CopG family [Anaerolineaceae bacterium]
MTVKTAVSLPEELFAEVDRLAKEMGVPRSRVFVMALESFLERKRNQALLEAINQVYAEDLTEEEQRQLTALKRLQGEAADPW